MQVKLVAITQPLIKTEDQSRYLTPEEYLVYVARVSNPGNQNNTDTSDRLIAYLMKKKHISPFEQCDLSFEIKTSRAIAAQILRHWSARFQEFSQRYAEVVEIEPIELREAPEKGKTRQGSGEVFDPQLEIDNYVGGSFYCNAPASFVIDSYIKQGVEIYKELLRSGVAKECARMILPLATQTTLYMKGDLRTWIFYLAQRTDMHAQKEHRLVAIEIMKVFSAEFPMVTKALIEAGIWFKKQ